MDEEEQSVVVSVLDRLMFEYINIYYTFIENWHPINLNSFTLLKCLWATEPFPEGD
jgi:hypothetical protein